MSCWLAKQYFCFILFLIYHVLCYHAWDLMWTRPFPWEPVMSRSCNWARKWTSVYSWVHFDHSPLLCILIIPGYAHISKQCLTERYRAKMYRVIYCLGKTTSLVTELSILWATGVNYHNSGILVFRHFSSKFLKYQHLAGKILPGRCWKFKTLPWRWWNLKPLLGTQCVNRPLCTHMYQYPDIGAWVTSVNMSSCTSMYCVRFNETCLPLTTGQLLGDLRP